VHNSSGELQALIRRCNDGDSRAWEDFYARYHPMISAAVRRRFSSHSADSEDLAQEVFINLFRALKHYDPARSIEAYILEIVRRVGISRYRKESSMKRGGGNLGTASINTHDGEQERGYISVASARDDQETELMKAQETRLLRRALGAISEACRQLLELRYAQGLSYSEISALLGVKEATLRSQAQRCLSSLGREYGRSPESVPI
jgi:RNA polymerase sigma-70 factor, ECF subfamily